MQVYAYVCMIGHGGLPAQRCADCGPHAIGRGWTHAGGPHQREDRGHRGRRHLPRVCGPFLRLPRRPRLVLRNGPGRSQRSRGRKAACAGAGTTFELLGVSGILEGSIFLYEWAFGTTNLPLGAPTGHSTSNAKPMKNFSVCTRRPYRARARAWGVLSCHYFPVVLVFWLEEQWKPHQSTPATSGPRSPMAHRPPAPPTPRRRPRAHGANSHPPRRTVTEEGALEPGTPPISY